jgi:Rrf2 family transcriptional regulator, iron-sulfur cluster assembly transcription factor
MRFTTKTEYGLVCLIYIAKHSEKTLDPISIKEMATAEGFSTTYIEKILQSLRAAKILVSHQGNHGGYSLAKSPSQITLKEVIEALEGATFDVFCEPEVRKDITCTHFSLCGIKPLWGKTKEILDQFYSSLTLEMLMNNTLDKVETKSFNRIGGEL